MTEAELRKVLEASLQNAIDEQMPFECIYGVLCGLAQRLQLVWAGELAIKIQNQKDLIHE